MHARQRQGHVHSVASAEFSRPALRFLAWASEQLASSLEYETTLQSLARLVIAQLADWCIIDIVERDFSIHRLVVARTDPGKDDPACVHQRRYPADSGRPPLLARALRTGRSELYGPATGWLQGAAAFDADDLHLLRGLGLASVMVVPLVACGRTLGAVWFVSGEPRQRYTPVDLALAEALARRAAVAIENARFLQESQAALRARSEFLAAVAHDLKTPLAVIKGWAQLLLRRAQHDPACSQEVETLSGITETANAMACLIDDLLEIARLEAGQELSLELDQVDLGLLTARLVERHAGTTDRHVLHLQAGAPGSVVGRWDARRLEQVVNNLLSNAIKYGPAGGEITVTVERQGQLAVLLVRDQGIGIPTEDLPHVFEWFRRARNVAGRVAGTGLGLAVARQIVGQHGGEIALDSEEGRGTTATVRLPLAPSV